MLKTENLTLEEAAAPPRTKPAYRYSGTIVSVYDGDSLTVDLDMGKHLTMASNKVRVLGIDCAELRSKQTTQQKRAKEKELAIAARDYARSLMPAGAVVTIESHGEDLYGRTLANVYLLDGTSLAERMIVNGHAVPYTGEKARDLWDVS